MYVGGELASVNVGLADGVQLGMVLEVRRKGAVVARLRVAEVSAHAAAGIVLSGSARPDDEVVVPPPAGTPATGPATTQPAKPISATITAVNEGVAGIDAGSSGGVRPGMVFFVFRGGEFVAHLRILEVGAATSQAMVYDMVRRPVPGDRAVSMGR